MRREDAPVRLRDARGPLRAGADALFRPREGWIPVAVKVAGEAVSRENGSAALAVRLREDAEGVGKAGDVLRAEGGEVCAHFAVGTRVWAFDEDGTLEAGRGRGRVRAIDTTVWPVMFAVEFEGGGGGEGVRLPESRLADAAGVEAILEARAAEAAKEKADAAARALLEEEEAERRATEARASAREGKVKSAKPKKVGSVSESESASDAARAAAEAERAAADEEAERARLAERAAAKAAARARQEEIKAAKAAKEKAAKREAQKARKALERASRELEERANAETRAVEENAGADATLAAVANASETESRDEPSAETDAEVAVAPAAPAENEPALTETQRRKLEKERRKAQRLAEIDALLSSYESAPTESAARDQDDGSAVAAARKRKNKKKKKPADAASVALAPKDRTSEWFAPFIVLAFFTCAGVAHYAFAFARRRLVGA